MKDEYLISLERDIIKAVDFKLTVPTLNNWLNIYTVDFDNFLNKQ